MFRKGWEPASSWSGYGGKDPTWKGWKGGSWNGGKDPTRKGGKGGKEGKGEEGKAGLSKGKQKLVDQGKDPILQIPVAKVVDQGDMMDITQWKLSVKNIGYAKYKYMRDTCLQDFQVLRVGKALHKGSAISVFVRVALLLRKRF
jgi:hypothetical protein